MAEIRAAVTSGRLHAAMHSLKDMPGNEDTPGLVIGATSPRDPPADALVFSEGLSVWLSRTSSAALVARLHGSGTNASAARSLCTARLFRTVKVIHFLAVRLHDTRVSESWTIGELQRLPQWRRGRDRPML